MIWISRIANVTRGGHFDLNVITCVSSQPRSDRKQEIA